MRILTGFVFDCMHRSRVRRHTMACLVYSEHSEHVLCPLNQVDNVRLSDVTVDLSSTFPLRLEPVLLLNDVLQDGRSTIALWLLPLKVNALVVIICYYWRAWLARCIFKAKKSKSVVSYNLFRNRPWKKSLESVIRNCP